MCDCVCAVVYDKFPYNKYALVLSVRLWQALHLHTHTHARARGRLAVATSVEDSA